MLTIKSIDGMLYLMEAPMDKIRIRYGDVKLHIEYRIIDRQGREMEIEKILDHDYINVYDFYEQYGEIENIEEYIFDTLDRIDYDNLY